MTATNESRTTPAPSRTTDARLAELARYFADMILHSIGHCGDGVQVYADMIDSREVALRMVQHLYDDGSDVLLTLRATYPSPAVLSGVLSAAVGPISERSIQARWRAADSLRQADDEAERLYAQAVEADRTAQQHAARKVRAVAASTPGAERVRGFGDQDAMALRDEDAAPVEPVSAGLARDGAEAA